ncbi:MAG: pyruvate dehydrogenase, partial [Saprospiraceae bacterium]|nr:pyruvate dehydrogenase [Saprospiraceae bacterium]
MAEVIRMPRLSDTMEEGNIVSWLKSVGDKVEPGDILAEVETDKATMELESFNDGVLLHIGVPEGPVAVEGVIAIIGDEGEDISGVLKEIENESSNGVAKSEEAKEEPAQESSPAPTPQPAAPKTTTPASATPSPSIPADGRIKASPLARKMAEESGIDISRIQGTGENGRIVKRDIDNAIEHGVPSAASSAPMQMQIGIDESQYGDRP